MDDDRIHADFRTLASSAENYALVAADLLKDLEELEGTLKTKLAEWQADPSAESISAQQAYDRYQKEWHAGAMHMQQTIHKLGLSIGNARENYLTAEKYGHAIFDGN